MEGIIFLNETSRLCPGYEWAIALIMVGMTIAISAGLLTSLIAESTNAKWAGWVTTIVCTLVAVAGIFIASTHQEPIYWITVSDEVTINQLNEDYEIIGYKGQILKVVERHE